MDIEQILEDIGLTKNETQIYLALLKLGSTTTGAIIKQTGIHNSKVYDGLERLASKGLVTHVLVTSIKHFRAVGPERLVDFLENKQKSLELQKQRVSALLPQLTAMQETMEEEPEAEIFKGWRGMETVFNEGVRVMEEGDTWYVLGAYEGEDAERTNRFIQRVITKCEQKRMKWKVLYNESARKTFAYEQNSPITENRFLSQETPATINVYKDVMFIALWMRTPLAFRVKSKEVAASFRQYFDTMWQIAKE